MNKLEKLYLNTFGEEPYNIDKIASSGSNRKYYRLGNSKGQTVIGVIGTSVEENNAFITLSSHFLKRQIAVPKVLAVSDDKMSYLQTDVGGKSLFDFLSAGRKSNGRYNLVEQELLKRIVRELPNIQIRGARGLDFSCCYPQAEFDTDTVLFDLNYFKYCFLKATNLDFNELKLEANFRLFAKDLTSESIDAFLYRDFQARNIMLDKDNNPYFIDFQGGRRGPYYYDLASFVWQASAKYSYKLRRELVYEYYNSLKNYIEVPSKHYFVNRLSLFVLFRLLQVLGAYGFRGYFERKSHFLSSIPAAIENLREILSLGKDVFHYPYMLDMLNRLVSLPQFNFVDYKTSVEPVEKITTNTEKQHLVVRVFSFSYKKGIPVDASGNGGGYVFDCRSIHNPGRYTPYKNKTGLDDDVIRFLEDDGEIIKFLKSVYSLADHHIERYIERGFTNLMFSFGCTGGQHRSVYSAQHLAEHISKKYGIEVQLLHREQNISQVFKRVDTVK